MPIEVMIVEDDRASSKLLEIAMRRLGYHVCAVASTGREALKISEQVDADILLMDINLPGDIDGITTAAMIKEGQDIPVLFITANDSQEIINRAIATDPMGYIMKPYSIDNLRVMIEVGVYRQKIERKIRESELFLDVLISSIGDGVVAAGPDLSVRFANKAAASLLFFEDAGEIIGKPLEEVCHLVDERTHSPLSLYEISRKADRTARLRDALLIQPDGNAIPVEYMISALEIKAGQPNGYILTLQDITLRKQHESSLLSQKEELEALVISRTAEIRMKNILLEKEIRQKNLYEAELKKALEKEKEINHFRSNIVTTLSHEFKTPLTTIQSSAQLIEKWMKESSENDKTTKHLFQIRAAVSNLIELLDDVLLIERMDGTSEKAERRPLDIEHFLNDIVETCKTGIGKEHQFEFRHNAMPFSILTDPRQLKQILNNLLSNAFKYSESGTRVLLLVYFSPDSMKITVSDQGIGIPEENLGKLFETFYRADNVGNIKGTGLGLSILKKSVDLLGGQVSVSSEPGKGSTFTVTLPL